MSGSERSGRSLTVAHRGASAYAPENTIAAFDLAVDLGADAIELDVHRTRDGVLVAVHDDDLQRVSNGTCSRSIADLTWSELEEVDVGSWFNDTHPPLARVEHTRARVPRLDDIFARYGRSLSYLIELKHSVLGTGMENEIASLARAHSLTSAGRSNVLVATFSQKSLLLLHELDPSVGRVQLFHPYANSAAIRAYLDAIPGYCSGIGPSKGAVEGRLAEACRRHSLDVFAWTVNDPHEMDDLIDLEVAGIVTDFPDLLGTRLLRSKATETHAERPGRGRRTPPLPAGLARRALAQAGSSSPHDVGRERTPSSR